MSKLKKSKTHFEQVPLKVVREIATEDISDDEMDQEDLIIEPPEGSEPHIRARGRRGKRPSAHLGRP